MSPVKRHKAEQLEARFQGEFFELLNQIKNDSSANEYNFRGFRFPDIRLKKILFQKPVSFFEARFNGFSDFTETTFQDSVDFHGAIFRGFASFANCIYKGRAEFLDTRFEAGASFGSALFKDRPVFMKSSFDEESDMSLAVFEQGASFIWVRFNGLGVHFATFEKDTVFEGNKDNGVFQRICEFTSLRLRNGATILFDHVDLSHVTFLDTDLQQARFRNVKWFVPPGWPRRNRALWDEFRPQVSERTYPHVAENYRQLVINYEKNRDYEAAEDFHIGEMEMRRKTIEVKAKNEKWRKYSRKINTYRLYRFLSNYGTSYCQAALVFAGLFLFCSWVFLFTGLVPTKIIAGSPILYSFAPNLRIWAQWIGDYLNSMMFTFSIVTFQRERSYEPMGAWSQVWTGVTSLLLTSQAALVLLAIRRRFKR
jgi:uncharacterized protein YjbI with pentapeptide repeats